MKYYSGAFIDQQEINIMTDNKIDDYCSRNIHKIFKKGKVLIKNGRVLPNVMSQDRAVKEVEAFISGGDYIVSHGIVDTDLGRPAPWKYFLPG